VTDTYNPSHSGGKDQEDLGSKPAYANSPQDPISKKLFTKKKKRKKKKAGRLAQGEDPGLLTKSPKNNPLHEWKHLRPLTAASQLFLYLQIS
jgi:hypothetical protein